MISDQRMPVPAGATSTNASVDFMSLGALLFRHKSWLFVSGLAGIIIAIAIVAVMPVKFSSEAALLVERRQAHIPDLNVDTASRSDDQENVTPTLSDILSSPGLLKGIVDQLDLGHAENLQPASRLPGSVVRLVATIQQGFQTFQHAVAAMAGLNAQDKQVSADSAPVDPDAAANAIALKYLQNNLKVTTKEHSGLLTVQFRAGSAKLAADVVNRVLKDFVDLDEAHLRAQLTRAHEWLLNRAAQVRAEIDSNEGQLQKLIQDNDVGEIRDGSMAAQRLIAAQSRLAIAREDQTRRQAALDTARNMAVQSGSADAAQEALASPTINALLQRQAELLQRLGGSSILTYSTQTRLQDELRSVRSQINIETQKIVIGLSRDAEIARANVQALQLAVIQATQDTRQSSAAQVRFASLTRNVDMERQLYDSLVLRADQTQLASGQLSSTRVLFQATPPQMADRPNLPMMALLGLIGGGALGSAIVMLRHLVRDRVMSARDVARAAGVPVFGTLPTLKASGRRGLRAPAASQMSSAAAETLRAMWLTIRSATAKSGCTTVVVTSSEVGEGKTTVAVALARRTAADGLRVMLIDADLRCPRVATAMGLPSAGRLGSLLAGKDSLAGAIVYDPRSGLDFLAAGPDIANPTRMLASDGFGKLLTSLRERYDLIVLDSPPIMRVADAVLLSQLSQVTLLVVQSGRLSKRLLADAVSRFPAECRQKILALLTQVPSRDLSKHDYYGGYGAAENAENTLGSMEPDWLRASNALATRQGDVGARARHAEHSGVTDRFDRKLNT